MFSTAIVTVLFRESAEGQAASTARTSGERQEAAGESCLVLLSLHGRHIKGLVKPLSTEDRDTRCLLRTVVLAQP